MQQRAKHASIIITRATAWKIVISRLCCNYLCKERFMDGFSLSPVIDFPLANSIVQLPGTLEQQTIFLSLDSSVMMVIVTAIMNSE